MNEPRRPVLYSPEQGTWLSFHGVPSRIVASGSETDSSYCVSVGTSLPGGQAPPHSHTFSEGFWINSGTIQFTAGNETLDLEQGSYLHLEGGVAHFPRNVSDSKSELITFCFPAGFEAFQKEIGLELLDGNGPFPKATKEVEARMKQIGPDYGIDLEPAPEEFDQPPRMKYQPPGKGETIGVVGDVYRFLVTGSDTEGQYALWHATIYPQGGPPPHQHSREEEFFYVLSGEVMVYDDGNGVPATPGTAINLPKGSRHWFKNESEKPAEMLILVAPAGIEDMFREAGKLWNPEKGNPGPPAAEEIEKLIEIAPDFGITLG